MRNKKRGYPWLILFAIAVVGLATLLFGLSGGVYVFFVMLLLLVTASVLK